MILISNTFHNTLSTNAERNSVKEENENNKYIRVERSCGKYSRQFDVSLADTDKITAKYDNGVLNLTLPKKQEVAPETKKLEIL